MNEGIYLNGVPQTDDTIIAAGPLSKQPSTMAYRIVLRLKGTFPGSETKEYVVHTQYFPNYPELNKFNFQHGQYFDNFAKAVENFGKKIEMDSEYLKSLDRVAVTPTFSGHEADDADNWRIGKS